MAPPKKKKFTIIASEQGIEKARRALIRLGFESKSNFAESQLLSRSSVTKFFKPQPVQLDTFKRICEGLKLSWRDIAGLEDEHGLEDEQQRQSQRTNFINLEDEEGVESVQTLSRSIIVIDESTQTVKAEITLKGDINSVDNFKTLELILRQYSGETIKITDIQEGSIKLRFEGSQDDINRLVERIKSGELAEFNGFPIENLELLSESLDEQNNEESANKKWDLIKEIVSQPTQNRNLRGVDLSDANLRRADLYGANLREADLTGADLREADLREADLREADLREADLTGAKLTGTFINESTQLEDKWGLIWTIINKKIKGLNLREADLREADLRKATLYGAKLNGADLNGAYLNGARLNGADLRKADLRKADLREADLREADLRGANLDDTEVVKAKFSSSNLGMTEELKQDLINRGAIFEDSLKDPLSLTPVKR